MQRCLKEGKPLIYNFVDFKKAFDSLDWSTMWKVLEAQGMPTKIVNIIKELYNNATVSVRLNSEDKMAPSFSQKVGIRQGCSLSPALFILVLDFALKAFTEACEELGIDADAAWLGYADDLAVNQEVWKQLNLFFINCKRRARLWDSTATRRKRNVWQWGFAKRKLPRKQRTRSAYP
jgi:hypothetical protein